MLPSTGHPCDTTIKTLGHLLPSSSQKSISNNALLKGIHVTLGTFGVFNSVSASLYTNLVVLEEAASRSNMYATQNWTSMRHYNKDLGTSASFFKPEVYK